MKFISWNVNGLRACVQKGFLDFFNSANADFFCLQETKLQAGQIALELPGYEQYWCYAEKKGYSGTAIFTKHTPQSVQYGIGIPELDTEGRVITLEYPEFYLVTCYTPNAQRGLARIDHRLKWEESFRNYLAGLDSKKCVVLCGDLNVAHKEIDLKNPAANRGNAGFSDEERAAFTQLLDSGFTDTFRHLNPDSTGCYTWWSYMFNARQNNAGWRIDYFLVSDGLRDAIYRAPIHNDILGSDHCPVELDLDVSCNGGIWQSESAGTAAEIKPEKPPMGSPAKKALLSGTAVLLLAVGFAAGFFTNQALTQQEETDPIYDPLYVFSSNLPLSNVIVPDGDIISEYDARQMTTAQLVRHAVKIPELSDALAVSSTQAIYQIYCQIRNMYPVLAELETRKDALNELRMYVMLQSNPGMAWPADFLAEMIVYQYEPDTNNIGINFDFGSSSDDVIICTIPDADG